MLAGFVAHKLYAGTVSPMHPDSTGFIAPKLHHTCTLLLSAKQNHYRAVDEAKGEKR